MRRTHVLIPGLILLLLAAAPGCSSNKPGMRIGALPFPGMFTLYEAADPDNLGPHAFGPMPSPFSEPESRGIVYACRAGFLDIVHIRDTADLAWYYHGELSEAARDGRREVVLQAIYPSHFMVTLHIPDEWKARDGEIDLLPPALDEALVELSLQIAWIATTWHEIITWFGYKSTVLIPEHQSAFTYDDTMSHVVGIEVARRVFRHRPSVQEYNATVTRAIDDALDEFMVVPLEQMEEAVRMVEGSWWINGRSLKRHVEIGLTDGIIRPWLVRGLEACGGDGHEPEAFDVPPLLDSLRPDGQPLATIEIDPRVLEAGMIRAVIPDRPRRIVPHRDFVHLMQRIREDFTHLMGEDFDTPYPN